MTAQSQQNTNLAASALFIGETSPLLEELKKQLNELGVGVYQQTDGTNYKCTDFRYVFYALTEKTLSAREYQDHLESVKKTVAELVNQSHIKLSLLLRSPSEYVSIGGDRNPSFVREYTQHDILQHQTFLLSAVETVKKYPEVNSRVISYEGVVDRVSSREIPVLSCLAFSMVPEFLLLPNSQNEIIKPVQAKKVAKEVIKTVFSQHSKHQIYELVGSQGVSLNSVSFEIQKSHSQHIPTVQLSIKSQNIHFPASRIRINNENDLSLIIAENKSKAIEQPRITAPKVVAKSPSPPNSVTPPVRSIVRPTGQSLVRSKPQTTKPSQEKNKKAKTHLLTYPILAVTCLTITTALVAPVLYYALLKSTITQIKNGDFNKATQTSQVAQKVYPIANKTASIYLPVLRYKAGDLSNEDMTNILSISREVTEIVPKLSRMKAVGDRVVTNLVDKQKVDVNALLEELKQNTQFVYEKVNNIKAMSKTIINKNTNQSINTSLNEASKMINDAAAYLEDGVRILSVADELLGVKAQKTFIVLLQNNHELRATGGFIGSFALVTLNGGKILDIETYDVYSADGQLRGHVEPPAALKKYLGEANWFLRDSNWDPNFPTTARRVEWFLNKELGRQVDGTIGIDLFVVKDLLNALGGVSLADYNETITAENIFERAEFHSELNYFEGSTQKKDFLSALINAMYVKLGESSEGEGLKIVLGIVKNASQSHFQVSFRENDLESSLEDTIFSGKVKNPPCTSQEECVQDYFGVVESNVGVNKVNYFVERTITKQTTLETDKIKSSLNIRLKNTAKSNTWPAGNYKNYLRFVIPEDASIIGAKINGLDVESSLLEVEIRHNKKYVGIFVEVPLGQEKEISLTYQLKNHGSNASGYNYEAFFEKQAGIDQDPLMFTITNNTTLTLWNESGGLVGENSDEIKSSTLTDRQFVYRLSP